MKMFKKGDRVRCLEDHLNQFTKDWIYTVRQENRSSTWCSIVADDNGEPNGMDGSKFELVEKQENKMKVNYLLTKGSITLQYDGKTKLVAKDDQRFEKVVEAIRGGKNDQIPEIVEPELYLKKHGLSVEDGLVTVKGEAMPFELNARILEYQAQQLPFSSLMKFWDNLKQNPSFNSRKQLFKFLENQGHSITEDGCFIGYRGVTSDFKDKHSGKFDNSPGSVCEMPRDQVDDNPDNTCSHGLHVGGYQYAKDFGPTLVLVKVNPKDVVAVPNDYNGQKMRVCRFEVLSVAENVLTAPVVGSNGGEYNPETMEDDSYCDACGDYEWPLNRNGLCDGCCEEENEADEQARQEELENGIRESKKDKKQYANNHSKRDKSGRFAPKKKTKKKVVKNDKKRRK